MIMIEEVIEELKYMSESDYQMARSCAACGMQETPRAIQYRTSAEIFGQIAEMLERVYGKPHYSTVLNEFRAATAHDNNPLWEFTSLGAKKELAAILGDK